MIKVITLDTSSCDIENYKVEDENIPEYRRKHTYESSMLNELIEDGWTIKDWKMCIVHVPYRSWTFILEKEDEYKEYEYEYD